MFASLCETHILCYNLCTSKVLARHEWGHVKTLQLRTTQSFSKPLFGDDFFLDFQVFSLHNYILLKGSQQNLNTSLYLSHSIRVFLLKIINQSNNGVHSQRAMAHRMDKPNKRVMCIFHFVALIINLINNTLLSLTRETPMNICYIIW